MDYWKGKVDWNKEMREFIKKRIEEERKIKLIHDLELLVDNLQTVPAGTAAKLLREDRDSH